MREETSPEGAKFTGAKNSCTGAAAGGDGGLRNGWWQPTSGGKPRSYKGVLACDAGHEGCGNGFFRWLIPMIYCGPGRQRARVVVCACVRPRRPTPRPREYNVNRTPYSTTVSPPPELGRGVAAGGGGVARGADVVGAHGLQASHGGARAHSPVVQAPDGHHGCARDGPAPATAGATRSTWGSRECSLSTSRRRADREHQRQAREQAERRSEEVVRMAQEHYFPWGESSQSA